MATRFKVNPPTRPDGKELIKFTCQTCGDDAVTDVDKHVRDGRLIHDRDIILEGTQMKAWYTPAEEGEMYG